MSARLFAMMSSFLVLAAACAGWPVALKERPVAVSPEILVRTYRDSPTTEADPAWKGRAIIITLPAGNYKISGKEIHWYANSNPTDPVIVFAIAGEVPSGNDALIHVEGTCAGMRRDGHRRGPRIDFDILIENCCVNPNLP